MPSVGELQLLIDSRIAGGFRVETLRSLGGLYPRLGVDLEVTLEPLESGEPYQLTDLSGELRIEQGGPVMGRLHWYGPPWLDVPSKPRAAGMRVTLACDLHHGVLDRFEAQRSGAAPRFWIDLWPRLDLERGGFVRSWIRGTQLAVPREQWLRVLEDIGFGLYESIEIYIPRDFPEGMRGAVEAFRAARKHLERGDWREALGRARYVVDRLEQVARPKLPAFLKAELGKQGEHWSKIASSFKDLTSLAHHAHGESAEVTPADARGAVQTALVMIDLVSDCLARSSRASGTGH